MAGVDGRKGLPEAIAVVLPKPPGLRGRGHKVRNSLRYGPWQARRAVAADLRALCGATTRTDAAQALERCAERWDSKSPAISPRWIADWARLPGLFDSPPAIRRVI
jgi:transposase-like protein